MLLLKEAHGQNACLSERLAVEHRKSASFKLICTRIKSDRAKDHIDSTKSSNSKVFKEYSFEEMKEYSMS